MNDSISTSKQDGLEIAIVGMSGRFPMAKNVGEFWQNLRNGLECISFFSDEQLLSSGVAPSELKDFKYVGASGVLEDIELFDASFFVYSPKDAELLDPQQRLFLECAEDALENAGYDALAYNGLIGMYAGTSMSMYLLNNLYSNQDSLISENNLQTIIANDKDFLSTRVSYKLDLKGPSVTVQTACSTSLVAVHMACQGLISGECSMALAGGVSIHVPQKVGYRYYEGGIASPDGHCRAFDAQAQGMVSGSGMGIVVLKRLADALADGDTIHAVIKGSAINNDGSLKVGYTAPSIAGQVQVIRAAQLLAEVEPETISYIEAHGTGTPLGDPIEIAALTQAFGDLGSNKGFCAVGSAKTNIGHLDAAAGIAGLIKTVLALTHKELPPSLHFQQPNPQIDFANSPFYVNATLSPWKTQGKPRRAGVSSFGIGGTNAHLILEEAPQPTQVQAQASRPGYLLVLSAKTSTARETATINLLAHLKAYPDLDLADVAYTLQVGRRAFTYRQMLVCQDLADAIHILETSDHQSLWRAEKKEPEQSVVFLFPGQGAQYVYMAHSLYHHEALFREIVDRCAVLLDPQLGLDLRTVLFPPGEQTDDPTEASKQLNQTWLTQPALFVIEYALARLWMSWGIHPQAMIGHSIGEYVAACLAGVFSLEEALSLVAWRGQLIQRLPGGTMLAVALSSQEIAPLLGPQLSLAAVNAPKQSVVSGPPEVVEALAQHFTTRRIACSRLFTSHAFHSAMMDPILNSFLAQFKQVHLQKPHMPYLSNVTGTWITPEQATNPNYWVQHLRQTVRFAEGLQELLQQPNRVLLEVGPGQTLSAFAKQQMHQQAGTVTTPVLLSSLPPAKGQPSDAAFILNTLGRLWLAGVDVQWSDLYSRQQPRHIPLPTYPFERQRYWIDHKQAVQVTPPDDRVPSGASSMTKNLRISDWFYVPFWKPSLLLALPLQEVSEQKLCWLVFAEGSDGASLSNQLAQRLKQIGQDVILVLPAERFSQLAEHTYFLNPSRKEDYVALVQELEAQNKPFQRLVHLWSTVSREPAQADDVFLDTCQTLGFYSLLFLVQALERRGNPDALHLWVVSTNLQRVTDETVSYPEKAPLQGLCKVIPQEYPSVRCTSVDLVLPPASTWQEKKLLDLLTTDLLRDSSETTVAYRNHQRWVQTFEPIPVEPQVSRPALLREEGVYLITGGFGRIGLVIAAYLAKEVHAKLILLGRTSMPESSQWTHWLNTHEEQNEVSRRIGHVRALEGLGAEVLVITADVAKEQEMHVACSQIERHFGTLHGVIYAAGDMDEKGFRPLYEMGVPECERHFRPKVRGLLVLKKVLHTRELDFCLLQSSLSSVLGGVGLGAYAAANLFMDAFAYQQTFATAIPWMSVNWDGWDQPEAREGPTRAFAASAETITLTAQEGEEVFRRLLSLRTYPQIVISTGSLQTRLEKWIAFTKLEKPEVALPALGFSDHSRPDLQTSYVPPRNETEQQIATIWQGLLGIDQIGVHDNFFALGGDSLLIIYLIANAKAVGISLTFKQIFQYPTIADLAAVEEIASTIQTEQNLVLGSLPLTISQHAFFEEREFHNPNHWNIPFFAEVQQDLDPVLLEQVVRHLLVHHDALRLRFVNGESGWRQFISEPDEVVPITRINLSTLTEAEQRAAIETIAAKLQTSLNLSEGPVLQIALFDLGTQRSGRLLWIVHHLVADAVSLSILLEDFQIAYQQLSANEDIHLPAKTTSYKEWAKRQTEYAQSPELQQELDYQLSLPWSHVVPLPLDYPKGKGKGIGRRGMGIEASSQSMSVSLDKEETHRLLEGISKTSIKITEVLLTAFVQTLKQWAAMSVLYLFVVDHGRETTFKDIDLLRTVGLLSFDRRRLFDLREAHTPEDMLKLVKEQLQHTSNQSDSYDLLRYLSEDTQVVEKLRNTPTPMVAFNYLGQVFNHTIYGRSPLVRQAQEYPGPVQDSQEPRSTQLALGSMLTEGQLRLLWHYSEDLYQRATIEALAESFKEELWSLVNHFQVV